MKKDIIVNLKFNQEEINIAEKSIADITTLTQELTTKLAGVPIGSKDFKLIKGDLDNLEEGFKKAKFSTQPFLKSLSELPGAFGFIGQSVVGVKDAFTLLSTNPLVAVLSVLATIVMKVSEKLKNMEGVLDPLEKAAKIFGGTMEKIANFVLPIVIKPLEFVINSFSKLMDLLGEIGGNTSKVGENLSYVADSLDELSDSNAAFELSQAKSNRQLQEAREIAADTTKTNAERIKALRDAEKIERQIAEEKKARALKEAQAKAVELAVSLGYNAQQIDAIKKYDQAKLESFAKEIQGMKGLNRQKSDDLYKTLSVIDDTSAQIAKIGSKTQKQVTSLEKDEINKRKELQKEAAQATKEYLKKLQDYQFNLRLDNIQDEKQKALVSLQNQREKSIQEIKDLKLDKVRKQKLIDAANADYDAKERNLREKQRDERIKFEKSVEEEIALLKINAIQNETDRAIALENNAYEKRKNEITKKMIEAGTSTEEMLQVLETLEKDHNKKIDEINKTKTDKDKKLQEDRIKFEEDTLMLSIQNRLKAIDYQTTSEIEKIKQRQKLIDEQTNLNRQKELDDLKKKYDDKLITEEQYKNRQAEVNQKYDNQIKDNSIKTEQDILNSRTANINAVKGLSDAIGQVAQAMGEETAAGKALIKVQQALALASTVAALAQSFEGLGKDLKKGFPTNIIAVTSTLALIATAITQFKALTGFNPKQGTGGTENMGRNYEVGGMIEGPRHAQGGVMIEAEGGEAIMTRGAVTMFRPLLSMLNQMGGGTSFSPGAIGGSRPDAPLVETPSISQSPQIIKTYVVSNELTTEAERQAKLKDLSTL